MGGELERINQLSNDRFSESKRARGKLKMLMDENKAAASEEVKSLKGHLMGELDKLDAKRAANAASMKADLTQASKQYYEKLAGVQKKHEEAGNNSLALAQANWDSKIVMTANQVSAEHKKHKAGLARVTGVVEDYAKASAADRQSIKAATKAAEANLDATLKLAIQDGEAKAKAVEQRIAEHLKGVKRFLQVELASQVEGAA